MTYSITLPLIVIVSSILVGGGNALECKFDTGLKVIDGWTTVQCPRQSDGTMAMFCCHDGAVGYCCDVVELLGVPAVVGIAIAVVVVIAIIIGLCCFCCRR